jgi:hypothetical protein
MFKKFFGKKNDGFYMQVDESAPPKADKSKSNDVVAKTEAVPAKESLATQPSASVVELIAAIDPVAQDQSESKSKSAKTSIKKDKKEKKAEEPIAANKATKQVASSEPVAPAFTNFATDYLVTPAVAGNRRRPGANMKGFMSMARDVKEMKRGSQGNQLKEKAAKKTEA